MKPNRSRSGAGSRPARVVAPTSVNGGSASGIAVAPGPLPTMTSTRKSSIATYSISSAGRAIRWISSRNSTSPSSSEDSTAARSPACWIAGPLVTRSGAPSSCATIIASVVLPRPGGPDSRTWSGARPRAAGRLEHERELVADHALADELVQPARPQRAPRRRAPRRRRRRSSRAGPRAAGSRAGGPAPAVAARRRPSAVIRPARGGAGRRAGRPATSGARRAGRRRRLGRPGHRLDRVAGLRGPTSPGPTSASTTWSRQAGAVPARPVRRDRLAPAPGTPSRSLSSSTMRCAPLRPIPGPASAP